MKCDNCGQRIKDGEDYITITRTRERKLKRVITVLDANLIMALCWTCSQIDSSKLERVPAIRD